MMMILLLSEVGKFALLVFIEPDDDDDDSSQACEEEDPPDEFFFVMNSDLNLFSIQIESTFFSGHPKSLTLEILLLLLFGWGLFVCFVQEEEEH